MKDTRPDPDALLEGLKDVDARAGRGTLKIFFGYAAGVGKTYAMLQAGHRARAAGRDVVIGYIEPHDRPETLALLEGLEVVPARLIEHRGFTLREFDVDAALARKPDLILVDELAHTNPEGCRHTKRWQDVEELLDAGIHVWTTLNVQHIESLNDVIGGITGVTVRETVPDQVFERADDLELMDIPPEELIERLRAGRVYPPAQAERALASFFHKSNLVALREFSLRQAARRVQSDVESARRSRSVSEPWATADRLLVCVGPSPSSARVIRAAKRMAQALDAPWMAVSVEKVGMTHDARAQARLAEHYRLAERLGAEVVTLAGQDTAATLLDHAASRNVTKILIGKTEKPRWKRLLFGSIVDDLTDNSGDIDIHVVRGEGDVITPRKERTTTRSIPWKSHAKALACVAVATLLAEVMERFGLKEANIVMIFLAVVALIAALFGRGPSIVASVVAVLIFDFCFVPPYFTFAVSDTAYLVTFAIMLAIALLISTLTARLRAQMKHSQVRERNTQVLYELGKQLNSISGETFLAAAAGRKVAELTGAEVAIYLGKAGEASRVVFGNRSRVALHPVSLSTANWVIQHDQIAGAGTDTLPNAAALFLPIRGSQAVLGALAARFQEPGRVPAPDLRRLLESCSNQLAIAIERDQMSIAASDAQIQAQTEQVRSTLLSGVSHDLRTPLAAIAGASSGLLQSDSIDDATRRQLLETIADEANRLTRLLENIIQMSRLEGGQPARMQWNILEEIVGSAVVRTRKQLGKRLVSVSIPPDLPLLCIDGLLLEQLFVNLLENAGRHTPPDSSVTIAAHVEGEWLCVSVADDGPGFPEDSVERIFDKFHRASSSVDSCVGSGLGLAICRALAKVHDGTISARNRPGGGAEFLLKLPLPDNPPRVQPDAMPGNSSEAGVTRV